MGRVVRGTGINYGGHLPAVGHVDPTPHIPCGMGGLRRILGTPLGG